MEYNTSQKKLILPEYGRHVHTMIQQAVLIKDREKRNRTAYSIIGVMGVLQPHLRDIPDFKHKLWDHLFIISEFKLDIDSPYPPPLPSKLAERPNMVPYPQSFIRQKHYGKIMIDMIREAGKMENPESRSILVRSLAHQMRKSYVAWNRSEVSNEQIVQDLWDISDGKIKMSLESIQSTEPANDIPSARPKSRKKKISRR